MKKIYTLIAASAVAFSAMATVDGSDLVELRTRASEKKEIKKAVPAFPGDAKLAPVSKNVRGLRKLDNNPTIEGFWTLQLGDYYYDTSEGTAIYCVFEATLDGSQVKFTPKENDYYTLEPFFANYDSENFKLTITKEFLRSTDKIQQVQGTCYIYQLPFVWDTEILDLVYLESISGTFIPEDYFIEFDSFSGIDWGVYRVENPTENDKMLGSLATYDLEYGYQFTQTKYLDGAWEEIGNVKFMDGWLIPAMGRNQRLEENQYYVLMEQSVENPYVYRLVNPYKEGPVAQYNGYEGDGYIVFDISDPDHVLFLPSEAGFLNYEINNGGGILNLYCYNYLGYLATSNVDYTVESIIEAVGDSVPFTTFKNGVVSLGYKFANAKTTYDANFGTEKDPYGGATWSGVNMAASITFPLWYDAAVEGIAADDNSPVEYFNLQGMKVANPEAGQILIKRQGQKVEKIIK